MWLLRLFWLKVKHRKAFLVIFCTGVTMVILHIFHSHLHSKGDRSSWEFVSEGSERVAEIVLHFKNMKHSIKPVFIVEEHFEVLKYWFEGAKMGLINQSGNTLLHIDGHSDGALPINISIIPWFRWPNSHLEVINMMQGNDVFITVFMSKRATGLSRSLRHLTLVHGVLAPRPNQAAALAGLINRYIWVWPSWDGYGHGNSSDHLVYDIRMGWQVTPSTLMPPSYILCFCSKLRDPDSDHPHYSSDWECLEPHPNGSEIWDGRHLESHECFTKQTGVLEVVRDSKALELAKAGGWISKYEPVLLDIDEDFYGCGTSAMSLYEVGIFQPSIDKLSELMGLLLCVQTVHQERLADIFFKIVLGIVMNFKSLECMSDEAFDNPSELCLTEYDIDQALLDMIPDFIQALKSGDFKDILCDPGLSSNLFMQAILRQLEDFTTTQLKVLAKVGVCLETAPTNFYFDLNLLHVCHGSNTPNNSVVTFFTPSLKEIVERTLLLKKILFLLPAEPSAVTVCRSVRDGYTPWGIFGYVEKSILTVLQQAFENINNQSFHYDENLLGGKKGWPNRDT